MRVAIKDIAHRAGVSPTTVSHLINDTRFVREETRSRVFKAIEECNYTVNPIARNLRSGNSMMIGFIASNLSNFFYKEVARGLNEVLQESGYNLIFIDSHENTEIEKKNIENFIRYSPDG